MRLHEREILIITGCTKRKLDHPAPAIELNQGQLFGLVKKLAKKFNFDIKILSGKHGLLEPNEVIAPYNQRITTQEDIKRIRKTFRISHIWRRYNDIIIIMGKKYRQVLAPYFDSKFIVIYDKRGIGGYLSLFSHYNKISKKQFLQEIEKFRIIDCANYLWKPDEFRCLEEGEESYNNPNHPHCCSFCTYRYDIYEPIGSDQYGDIIYKYDPGPCLRKNNDCKFPNMFLWVHKQRKQFLEEYKRIITETKKSLKLVRKPREDPSKPQKNLFQWMEG